MAVGAYFWSDIVRLVRAWLHSVGRRRIEGPDERVAWFVLVATIPAGVIGLAGENAIADHLGEPWQILILLSAGALLLYWADRSPETRSMGDLGLGKALVMGFAQALALAPGVSRSGITITAGRFMNLDRDGAARFSFYLLVPTVLGAVVLKGLKDVVFGDLPDGWTGPFVVGTLAALGSGLLAIEWLLGYVRRHTYGVFVVYRLVIAAGRAPRDRLGRPRRDVLSARAIVARRAHDEGGPECGLGELSRRLFFLILAAALLGSGVASARPAQTRVAPVLDVATPTMTSRGPRWRTRLSHAPRSGDARSHGRLER